MWPFNNILGGTIVESFDDYDVAMYDQQRTNYVLGLYGVLIIVYVVKYR